MTEYLYHGTTAAHANDIIDSGLRPPTVTGESNWEGKPLESHPEHVYLTRLFAPHYGAVTTDADESFAVVKVDTDHCASDALYPDEDFIEEALRFNEPEIDVPAELDAELPAGFDAFEERVSLIRERIDAFQDYWQESIELAAVCSHRGQIPTEAITCVAVVDPAPEFRDAVLNAKVGMRNVAMFGERQRLLTEWLFGGELDADEYLESTNVTTSMSSERRAKVERMLDDTRVDVRPVK